jgi:peptide/nickel transport system ATP-binding protein
LALLEVHGLSTHFRTPLGPVKAVDEVSFDVRRGEVLGLIGESGCGKSTVGLSILRLIEPPGAIRGGEILFQGENLLAKPEEEMRRLRWREISYVPQSAMNSLNPVYPVEGQVVEAIRAHEQVGRREARERARELLARVGLGAARVGCYPHELSGGMKQRAIIAMALACRPQLVIADESTTGLDVMTQAQVLRLMKGLQEQLALSLVFVSHDLPLVREICDRVVVMYAGRIVEILETRRLAQGARHPYTRGLMEAFVDLRDAPRKLESIPGNVPNLAALPPGCAFGPRCGRANQRCAVSVPALRAVGEGHWVACAGTD